MEEVLIEQRVEQANAQYNERVENDLVEQIRERQANNPNYHKEIFATWGTNAQSPFVPKTPGQLPRPVFEPVRFYAFWGKNLRTVQEKLPPNLRRLARMDELQQELTQLKRDNAELHVIIGKQGLDLKMMKASAIARGAARKRAKRDDDEDARSPH